MGLSMIKAMVVFASALGVAGCAKSLTADEMPRPRPGLWTWADVANGVTEGTGQTCSSGRPLHLLGPACPEITYDKTPDGVFETENKCDNGAKSDFKDRFSGDFQSSYVMDQSGVLDQPGKPLSVRTSRVTFTFAGPCRPGQTPDDVD
jgi:hypothetical protein